MFAYFGVRRIRSILVVGVGVAACTVVLVSAVTGGSSHVAVWMGVSTDDAQNWLQAGVEKTAGGHVAEYIEVGRHGRQVSLNEWPTSFGHRARIRLLHRNARRLWRISIDGHTSKWTWIPGGHVNTLALLERYRDGGTSGGIAVINGHKVHT
jgi:hypothetical protein